MWGRGQLKSQTQSSTTSINAAPKRCIQPIKIWQQITTIKVIKNKKEKNVHIANKATMITPSSIIQSLSNVPLSPAHRPLSLSLFL